MIADFVRTMTNLLLEINCMLCLGTFRALGLLTSAESKDATDRKEIDE